MVLIIHDFHFMFGKNKKIHINAWALTGALTSSLFMLILSLVNEFGLYTSATREMMKWHMYYSPTVQGTVLGMIEAGVLAYIVIYVFLTLHKYLEKKNK